MGRTPDYKAAFMATLGADPGFYAPFEASAESWYRRYAEQALFLNHVLINPGTPREQLRGPSYNHLDTGDVLENITGGGGGIYHALTVARSRPSSVGSFVVGVAS